MAVVLLWIALLWIALMMSPRWDSTLVSPICFMLSGFQDLEQPIQLPLPMMGLGEWPQCDAGRRLCDRPSSSIPREHLKMPDSNTFISPAALLSQLESADVTVVDASWYLPAEGRDPKAEFLASRIPGAQFFDIDTVADLDHACPHMLPSERVFTDCVQALGIGANSRVVVYDGKGLFSAARAWWMFRVFGHDRVQILEGGLPGWIAGGYDTEQGEPTMAEPGVGFVAALQSAWVTDVEGVKAALTSGSHTVVRFPICRRRSRAETGRAPGTYPRLEKFALWSNSERRSRKPEIATGT